ncbi:MAG: cellulase family glycosylhydrolase [Firmicutes bacterium]|nr:cellulase family glycosylhydrolase [Bacillota bacterium]
MKYRLLLVILCVTLAFVPFCAFADGGGAEHDVMYARIAEDTGSVFSDVKAGIWYEDVVAEMTKSGILSGYPDKTFRPGSKITAAEFVAVIARCAELEDVNSMNIASAISGDDKHWAADSLSAAMNAGWYDWDEIPPTGEKHDSPITRQLAVKILMKALLPDVHGDYAQQAPRIRDISELDGRYYDAVFAAYAAGITEGDSAGNFNAKDGLTRAEACAIIYRVIKKTDTERRTDEDFSQNRTYDSGEIATLSGVSENGWLNVKGAVLCNERGERTVLRGMSSHGVHWYSQFTSKQAIANTARYGANLFRVAMYTGEGGYISRPETVKKQVISAADAAIANDMYVIIDWHILSDGNPMTYIAQSKKFFDEMSARYADEPAVIYEICNEPNGNVSWEHDIKPYAEEIIKVIRKNSPKAIILIGSGTWSQDINIAAANPINGKNLMYTCHFYAGTHGKWLRDRIDAALLSGIPIFVSEWGTSAADGNGGVFLKEAEEWASFMNARGLSWANWSLCDKSETSAALKPGTAANTKWTQDELSESGKFVFSKFK